MKVMKSYQIFYYSISLQKIQLAKIPFSDLMDSLSQSVEMKNYFEDITYSFDRNSIELFFDEYGQREILNYTHFAINKQFRDYTETENDGVFIFYILKVFGEVIHKNIKPFS